MSGAIAGDTASLSARGRGSGWSRYWFPEAPLADLAILRIIAVGTQVALMTLDPRYTVSSLATLGELPPEMYQPLPFFKVILFLLYGHQFSVAELQMLQLVTIGFGFAALVGLATRVTLPLFAIGTGVIQLWALSHGDIHHPEAVMIVALALLALSPAGAVLSVDAWLQRRKRPLTLKEQFAATSHEAKWPILLVQWFFGLMYLSACYAKLVVGDYHWANGLTLQYYLAMDGLRWGAPLGLPMSEHYWLALFGQWAILAFQSTFFLSLLIQRLKWIYVPIGMVMHVSIYFMFAAPFWQWTALYLCFVPWTAGLRYLGVLQPKEVAPVTVPKASVA
ncbi:hypothetical protein C1T17_12750 [Sphingobium sp. SCG-1]|uniref:hypothetical protein n=1 Tax=Sphingobium sp. SCG-1 TaxID=2072936 RepID=UPI000CD67A76|nr:hypothetical protein [Sphingobium sp. SCG-1]AUW58831.1 hypothetical protein C1T17_12750 [Sphingobium sp. SCG-1]